MRLIIELEALGIIYFTSPQHGLFNFDWGNKESMEKEGREGGAWLLMFRSQDFNLEWRVELTQYNKGLTLPREMTYLQITKI